jgi:hypothetical protein
VYAYCPGWPSGSVGDPNLDPQDWHVLGPTGSGLGSISQSGSFHRDVERTEIMLGQKWVFIF